MNLFGPRGEGVDQNMEGIDNRTIATEVTIGVILVTAEGTMDDP
jgi:hypothetical protein